jgi:hypothetical protein
MLPVEMFDLGVECVILTQKVNEQIQTVQHTQHVAAELGAVLVINVHSAEHGGGVGKLLEIPAQEK